jgi:two-component system phosphate regulon sensor histidine kinase PhoR
MVDRTLPSGVAAVERRAARRAFWLFLAVAVVCTAQVTWWLIIQVRDTDRIARIETDRLELRGQQAVMELNLHYGQLWRTVDSALHDPAWTGALPRSFRNDPAILRVTHGPPPTRSVQTPFGNVKANVWTWLMSGPNDSVWVLLDPIHPVDFLERNAPDYEFTGVPPDPAIVPWTDELSPVRPRAEMLEAIAEERRGALVMFASEGSFFVILIILGAYLIYRSVRQSADLRRRQRNFIASVTHELKAPLASVKLYAETIGRPEVGADDRRAYLDRMLEDIDRLVHLIDNTLMAGRLEEKGFHLKLKRTDLSRDVQEYVRGFRGFLDRQKFTLTTEIEEGVAVIADYDAMRRVLESLIENAVKYSDSRREALLRVAREGEHVRITVQDYGVGIPAAEVERVFDAFYRVGDEMTRTIKGTGLGLYLVREIVAAHGGTVQLHSDGPGQGVTATVTLRAVS